MWLWSCWQIREAIPELCPSSALRSEVRISSQDIQGTAWRAESGKNTLKSQ